MTARRIAVAGALALLVTFFACSSASSPPLTTTTTTPPTTTTEPPTTLRPSTTVAPPSTSTPTTTDVDAADDCLPSQLGQPDGALSVVGGSTSAVGGAESRIFVVEIEEGLRIDGECFADFVTAVMQDRRGWVRAGFSFARSDNEDSADLIVTLASPDTVDSRCKPLETNGWLSCWNGSRAMLNVVRWTDGIAAYDDLWEYRTYLINHEVGHALGYGHQDCPGPGEPAPLMMQQTIGLEGCAPNPWPTQDET
jgi:hypothetical protein